MTYKIKQQRTYTTWLTVEADSPDEAESKYLELIANGTAYNQELEQMDVSNEDYQIYPSYEKEEKIY